MLGIDLVLSDKVNERRMNEYVNVLQDLEQTLLTESLESLSRTRLCW